MGNLNGIKYLLIVYGSFTFGALIFIAIGISRIVYDLEQIRKNK